MISDNKVLTKSIVTHFAFLVILDPWVWKTFWQRRWDSLFLKLWNYSSKQHEYIVSYHVSIPILLLSSTTIQFNEYFSLQGYWHFLVPSITVLVATNQRTEWNVIAPNSVIQLGRLEPNGNMTTNRLFLLTTKAWLASKFALNDLVRFQFSTAR